ncbi:MAG: sel1 repeat family protein [Deltaproteobacteria bacterium]|nr:sel1 repeat family protein [Deltaproteobacteria bacterium]
MKKILIAICALLVSTAVLAAKPCQENDFKGCTKACQKRKNGPSCLHLAEMYLAGSNGAPQDDVKAYLAMKRGCSAGHAVACGKAGAMAAKGTGTEASIKTAAALYTKGCKKKDDDSCLELALLELKGDGVPTNIARATRRLDQLCNKKVGRACTALGLAYLKGETGSVDLKKAEEAFISGCKYLDATACDLHRENFSGPQPAAAASAPAPATP